MTWEIEFEQEAEKELRKLDRPQATRILKYLFNRIAIADDPRRFGEALKFDSTYQGQTPILKKAANVIKSPLAKLHNSRRSFYRVKKKVFRKIDHGQGRVLIHKSVKTRWNQNPAYWSENLAAYIEKNGWPD